MTSVSKTLVCIHQPNFFPWLGYFNKVALADLFIVMDNVQFPKTGSGTWMNRVRLLINGRPAWVTVPIHRAYHGLRTIRDVRISNHLPWRAKILRTAGQSYVRAPFFSMVYPLLEQLINNSTDRLVDFNFDALRHLFEKLGLNPEKIVLGTSLNVEGSGTDLLIAMVKAVGGTAYLCGGGAAGYQEDEKFAVAGVDLVYQRFRHPVYQQNSGRGFVPGLSIIDVLMNCGFDKTRGLVLDRSAQQIAMPEENARKRFAELSHE